MKMKRTLIRPDGVPQSISEQVVTPIMPSVVYASDSPDALDKQYEGEQKGYTYAREGHPNAEILALLIDKLEGSASGLVVSSGMAAISSLIMGTLSSGDHVLGGSQLYGRTLRLMREDLPRFGIQTSFADPTDIESVKNEVRKNTKMILIECVSNPTLRVADLEGIASLCSKNKILLAVDNTFTTPASIKPFEFGADFVIHSITKLLSGHSDTTLGYVSSKDKSKMEAIYNFSVSIGATPSPFDCWLAERGLATFKLRFEKAQKNAQILAQALKQHVKVKKVLYPSLSEHPDTSLAKKLLKGNGCNMVSFEISDHRPDANKFIENIDGIAFAPTLGDIGTTISHPGSSSHRYLNSDARKALGITEGFFRVSVGLEDPDELVGSFERALDSI